MNVELKLWLNDLVSGALRRMEGTTRSAFGGIDRSLAGTQGQVQATGRSIDELRRQIDAMRTRRNALVNVDEIVAANREIERLERNLNQLNRAGLNNAGNAGGGGIGKWLQGAFWGNLAAQGVMTAGRAAMRAGREVLAGGMEADAMKEQYKVLAGDQPGEQLYGELKKYVADSVFGPELYSNAKTMMAFGIAAKDVMPDMKMLGDVSMGSKEKMDLLTLAFSQTTSAGKLMGQDLLQYVNAGFNPLMVLAEKTGKKYEVLRSQMEKGQISAEMVREAFVIATSEGGKFNGMLDRIAKTPMGKLQAMQGSIEDAKMSLGVALAPSVSRLLDGLRPMVDGLPKALERLVPPMERAFARFEDFLPKMQEMGGVMADLLRPVGALLLSDEVGSLAKSAMELTATVGKELKPAVELAATAIGKFAGAVNWVIEKIDQLAGVGKVKSAYEDRKKEWSDKSMAEFDAMIKREELAAATKQIGDPTKIGGTLPRMPDSAGGGLMNKMAGGASKPPAPATDNADVITGGGRKVININFRNVVEHMHITGASAEDKAAFAEGQLKTAIYRIFAGMPA